MRGARRLAVGALLVLSIGGIARAGPPVQVGLDYRVGAGATGCPGERALRGEVAVRLGYDPFVPGGEGTVLVAVDRRGRWLRGVVRLEGPEAGVRGERTVRARAGRCGELVRALALSVSLALDAEAASRPGKPRRSAWLAPMPRRSRRPPEAPPPAPAVPPRVTSPGPAAWLSAGGLGALGAAPGPTGGAWVSLAWAWPGVSLGVEVRGDVPAREEAGGGAVEAGGLTATVAPCLRLGVARACALAVGGVLLARGVDLAGDRRRATAYAAAGLRAGLTWAFAPRWRLDARLDLRVPLARTTLRVGEEAAWRTPRVDGSLGLGIGWRFR